MQAFRRNPSIEPGTLPLHENRAVPFGAGHGWRVAIELLSLLENDQESCLSTESLVFVGDLWDP